MKLNKQLVIFLTLTSLLIAAFCLFYDPFRMVNPVKTTYFEEPNQPIYLPNRTVSNLDNWDNKIFYHCGEEKSPGYLLYRFFGQSILGAHIYAKFACISGDGEFSVSYSLNNQEYHIIEPIRGIQSSYEYILDLSVNHERTTDLWLKTSLYGRKSWCSLLNYSVEVYSVDGPVKKGVALASFVIILFMATLLLVAFLIYINRLVLQKLCLINPVEKPGLSPYFITIFFLFLLFPLVRVLLPTQFGFNHILEIYSRPLLYWRLAYLTGLFAVIAVTTVFTFTGISQKINESRISLLVLVFCMFFGVIFYLNNNIVGDGGQYFAWLHSFVIDHDLNFKNEIDYLTSMGVGTGVIPVIPTRIGTCIAWFPMYAFTHFIMGILKTLKVIYFEANGWSLPYITSIVLTSLLASFSGLVLCYKILRRFFSNSTSLLAAVMVYLGSAIFTWTFVHPSYTHAVDFFISTLFIYYWSITLGQKNLRQWSILATILFCAVLVREQNILLGALLVVEAFVEYYKMDKEKFRFPEFLRGSLVFLGVFIGELAVLAFFAFKGGFIKNFLFASEVIKAHNFTGLRSIETLLLYPTTGLLAATPIIALSFAGVVLLGCFYKRYPVKLVLITMSLLLVFFIEFCCLSLNFTSRLFQFNIGARYFINVTLLFMLGLGFLFESISKRKFAAIFVKVISWCAVIFYLFLNLQYQGHIITYMGEGAPWKQIIKQQFNLAYMIIPDVLTKTIFWSEPKLVSYFVGVGQHKIFYFFFGIILFILCVVINRVILPNKNKAP